MLQKRLFAAFFAVLLLSVPVHASGFGEVSSFFSWVMGLFQPTELVTESVTCVATESTPCKGRPERIQVLYD